CYNTVVCVCVCVCVCIPIVKGVVITLWCACVCVCVCLCVAKGVSNDGLDKRIGRGGQRVTACISIWVKNLTNVCVCVCVCVCASTSTQTSHSPHPPVIDTTQTPSECRSESSAHVHSEALLSITISPT